MDEHASVVDLSGEECRAHLHQADVGRVGTTIGALPAILPVNYAMLGDDIVFRSAPGTKLTAAVLGAPVAFEVDELDPVDASGWSVIVVGRAVEITDAAVLDEVGRLPLEPWAPGGRDHYIRIHTTRISGRRILTGAPGAEHDGAATASPPVED